MINDRVVAARDLAPTQAGNEAMYKYSIKPKIAIEQPVRGSLRSCEKKDGSNQSSRENCWQVNYNLEKPNEETDNLSQKDERFGIEVVKRGK